ncbi:hypothetical protein HYPSUDRAFT_32702 [Hypholoma sublateritium FD-334 SS-4]|uniref:F-box domain-containing protein n=1 Tax=Hypholoma sublateritium (strain FD-334 SS-4) TaxID=945553 RepID=A0A0D2QCF2_HYPSF|nr:hypothetical protein HYPSUDRAFT_32702 [Hypholoma sublateritium FD-334 SS-4]
MTLNPFIRSQSALLDVYLDTRFLLIYTLHRLVGICESIAPHLPRFRLFSVTVNDPVEAQTVFKHWTHHKPLSLKTLALTLNDSFFPHFSGQLPSVERLEIISCVKLPSLKMLQTIFSTFPQLQILILRDIRPYAFYGSVITDPSNSLDGISDAEVASLYPSMNLRVLAITLPRLEMGGLYLPKIMRNLEYVEIANPRDHFLASAGVTEENLNSAIDQCNGLRNLKKLRLFLAQDFVWEEATFISSLPEGIDLEIDTPPLSSKIALIAILNSKKFRSITIILPEESEQDNFIICKTFSEYVCSFEPTLACPTTLILPANETLDSQVINILGTYLTIKGSQESVADGLIDTSQMTHISFYEPDDVESEDDYDLDEEWEDYYALHGVYHSESESEYNEDPYGSD